MRTMHGHAHGHEHAHSHTHPDGTCTTTAHEHPHDHVHAHDPRAGRPGALHYGTGAAGGSVPGMSQARMVQIERDILAKNDGHAAAQPRRCWRGAACWR
jgi:hydrogenase nickel incorporation protein HypB